MAKNGCLNMILILAAVFVGFYFLQTMTTPQMMMYKEGMKNPDMNKNKNKKKDRVKENFGGYEINPASYDVPPNEALAAKLNIPGCVSDSDCGYKPKPDIIPPDMQPSAIAPTCPRPVLGQCDSPSQERSEYSVGTQDYCNNQMPQASCFPRSQLNPEELLPKDECNQWSKANPYGSGALADRNFLQAGWATGISTVGSVLRNANLQLRSEPPNPQQRISPWLQSTISPDLGRKPLELGGCA